MKSPFLQRLEYAIRVRKKEEAMLNASLSPFQGLSTGMKGQHMKKTLNEVVTEILALPQWIAWQGHSELIKNKIQEFVSQEVKSALEQAKERIHKYLTVTSYVSWQTDFILSLIESPQVPHPRVYCSSHCQQLYFSPGLGWFFSTGFDHHEALTKVPSGYAFCPL